MEIEPKTEVSEQEEPKTRRSNRSKRGTRIVLRKIPIDVDTDTEDDDPFEDCDGLKWSLKEALDRIGKVDKKKPYFTAYNAEEVTAFTFNSFSNSLITCLFRIYGKLKIDVQNALRIFYFGLEKSTPSRFRNLTISLQIHKVFRRYPWLINDIAVKQPADILKIYQKNQTNVDSSEPKKKKKANVNSNEPKKKKKANVNGNEPKKKKANVNSNEPRKKEKITNVDSSNEPKPFSEACKQYEIAMQQCKNVKIETIQFDQPINTMNQNLHSHNVNSPNTSLIKSTINNLNQFNQLSSQTLLSNDIFDENITNKHALLSEEYKNMISAINSNYQNPVIDESSKSNQIPPSPPCISEQSSSSPNNKSYIPNRWISLTEETITAPNQNMNLKTNTTNKLTPLMHFEKRKTKLLSEPSLSLGDMIVLVSYFYKLTSIEQHLLIHKMKILEYSKPYQAAYLREYVRTTCPLYDENEIIFKPLPEDLIISESSLDLHSVTCIDDIFEKDFCIFEKVPKKKRVKIEKDTNEFDFGSEFL